MWIRTNEDFISGEFILKVIKSKRLKSDALGEVIHLRVGQIQSWSMRHWFYQPEALSVILLINLKRSCSFKWPKKERYHSCAAQNTENISRKYPKCKTWFKNISDISGYWDLHCVPEEKWLRKSPLSSHGSPTILAKGPPRPCRAGPGQTVLLQSLRNNSIHTFDTS